MRLYENEAEIYRALADPIRLRILALLRVREACVCELVSRLPVSQPAVSQHLRKLRQAGWLSERRQKYWTYYAIRSDLPPLLAQIVAALPRDAEDEAWLRQSRADATCAVLPSRTGNGSEIREEGAVADGR